MPIYSHAGKLFNLVPDQDTDADIEKMADICIGVASKSSFLDYEVDGFACSATHESVAYGAIVMDQGGTFGTVRRV